MGRMLSSIYTILDQYGGLILGFAVLAAVLLLNQALFRRRWTSYPTREQYLAAHPECAKAGAIACHRCGQPATAAGVVGAGRIYRCAWCERELFRVDRGG